MSDQSATLPAAKPTSFLSRLPNTNILGPLAALLLAIIFFSLQSPNFFQPRNFINILNQTMIVAVLGIGQTLIILTAGIDLSCGMIMTLSSILMTKLAIESGWPGWLALIAGLALSTAIGFLNGVLISLVKLPSFIVTLGMYSIVFATIQIYSAARTITVPDDSFLHALASPVIKLSNDVSIDWGVLLTIGLFVFFSYALSNTAPGRHLYAVGNNPEAARLTGIPTQRMLLMVYTLAGFIYGIAAWLSVSRYSIGNPNGGQTENLETITAVVIGGTSLFGGRGLLIGTIIGALISGVFRSGLVIMGARSEVQILITGILVILAVATDQLSKGKNSR